MSRTWHGRTPIRTALTALLLAPFNWAGRKLDELIAADPAAGDEQGNGDLGVLIVAALILGAFFWTALAKSGVLP